MNQMTDRRWLVVALIGVILVSIIAVVLAPPPPAPMLSVRSALPDGAMALSLWLEQSGYTVRQVLSNPMKFGDTDLLFVLNPLVLYTSDEAQRLYSWVAQGHTLIVSGSYPFIINDLLQVFDLSLRYPSLPVDVLQPDVPTLIAPVVHSIHSGTAYGIGTGRNNVVVHLSYGGAPLLVSLQVGAGRVWVAGMQSPFTNRGLKDDGSAEMILNMIGSVPGNTVIGFDEARHGFQEPSSSLSGWLVSSPAGWGILLGLALTMVYITLHGRRFGRAVPIPEERLRREPVEYIQAMANLFRRSGQREVMLQHYSDQLLRRLSERYALDPRLSDAEWVHAIAARDSSVDEAAMRDLLARLNRNKPGEQELLETVIEVDKWLRKIS